MTIRPIEMNGAIQRTQDIGAIKQQEDTKPFVDQQIIQSVVKKEEQRLSSQVIETEKSDQEEFRYDAKEKGQSSYQNKGNKRRRKQEENQTESVIVKGQSGGFDIKI